MDAGAAEPQQRVDVGILFQVVHFKGVGGVEQHQHLAEVGLGEINQSDFGIGQLQGVLHFHIVAHGGGFAFFRGGLGGMGVFPAVRIGFSGAFLYGVLDLAQAVVGAVAGQRAVHGIGGIAAVGAVAGQGHAGAHVFFHFAALDYHHRHVIVVLKGAVHSLGEQGREAVDTDFLHFHLVIQVRVPLFQRGIHLEARVAQPGGHGRNGVGLHHGAVHALPQIAGANAQHADGVDLGIQGQGAVVLHQHGAFRHNFAVELFGGVEHILQGGEFAEEAAAVLQIVGAGEEAQVIALGHARSGRAEHKCQHQYADQYTDQVPTFASSLHVFVSFASFLQGPPYWRHDNKSFFPLQSQLHPWSVSSHGLSIRLVWNQICHEKAVRRLGRQKILHESCGSYSFTPDNPGDAAHRQRRVH